MWFYHSALGAPGLEAGLRNSGEGLSALLGWGGPRGTTGHAALSRACSCLNSGVLKTEWELVT